MPRRHREHAGRVAFADQGAAVGEERDAPRGGEPGRDGPDDPRVAGGLRARRVLESVRRPGPRAGLGTGRLRPEPARAVVAAGAAGQPWRAAAARRPVGVSPRPRYPGTADGHGPTVSSKRRTARSLFRGSCRRRSLLACDAPGCGGDSYPGPVKEGCRARSRSGPHGGTCGVLGAVLEAAPAFHAVLSSPPPTSSAWSPTTTTWRHGRPGWWTSLRSRRSTASPCYAPATPPRRTRSPGCAPGARPAGVRRLDQAARPRDAVDPHPWSRGLPRILAAAQPRPRPGQLGDPARRDLHRQHDDDACAWSGHRGHRGPARDLHRARRHLRHGLREGRRGGGTDAHPPSPCPGERDGPAPSAGGAQLRADAPKRTPRWGSRRSTARPPRCTTGYAP